MKDLLYLSRHEIVQIGLPLAEIVSLLRTAFQEKGEGRVEMPPKPGIHPQPDAFIHAMPAYLPGLRAAGLKWVSGFPANCQRDLPYISGLLILNDVDTGFPLAVMDCTWITAYRTAAATALSATFLARPESSVVAILACGLQGRTNLEALSSFFPLRRAYAYDVRRQTQDRFVAEMTERLKIEIVGVASAEEAVRSADIVVTSGPILKDPEPTIPAAWIRPGTFASAVDFDSYWSAEALASFERIATDDHLQFAYYRETGYFRSTPTPYADLGELVCGVRPGRESTQEKTLAVNLGVALEDIAVAARLYELALERGIGTRLEL